MKLAATESLKFKKLKMKLRLPHWQAVGLLECLWMLTARNAPQGDIGKHSNEDIAVHIEWAGDPDELIQALVDCRWLDSSEEHRLIVHDWHDHMPNWLKGNLKSQDKTSHSVDSDKKPESGSMPKHTAKGGAKHPAIAPPTEHPATISSPTSSSPTQPSKETPIPPLPKNAPERKPNGNGWDLKDEDLRNTQRLMVWFAHTKLQEQSHENEIRVVAAAERALSVEKVQGEPVADKVAYFVSLVRDANWKCVTDTDRDRGKLRHTQWSRSIRAPDPLGLASIFKSTD